MKIALIQHAAEHDRDANVNRGEEALRRAAADGAGLVCFPELGFERFHPQRPAGSEFRELAEEIPGPTTERFCALAKELGVVVVLNLFERDGERCFDSSPVIDADGALLGVTRMVHITDYEGFHEQGYYAPGDRGLPVYETAVGRVGVMICYDRHYPEAARALALAGAELVVVPQAGAVGEWPEGMFEAEMRTVAFQNGYHVALCNRVGEEESVTFAGESFVCEPGGAVVARAAAGAEDVLLVDVDLEGASDCAARRLFLRDRRPALYAGWFGSGAVRHVLATLGYRLEGAVRGADASFGEFDAGRGVRSPVAVLRHMTRLMLFSCRELGEDVSLKIEEVSWSEELVRFRDAMRRLDELMADATETNEILLQGPICDAMTHVGQIAMLRRLHGDPVAGENFMQAEIEIGRFA